MKFQKYMAVGILGLTMALGFSGCQSENQKNQDAYRKIGINSMAEGDYDKAVKSFHLFSRISIYFCAFSFSIFSFFRRLA